jgi:5,10-methylene-tetrahydrofolate dehydrogenase/methenyl tetrahydrofolate cyclohydrolase
MEGKELADWIIESFPQRIKRAQKHFNVTEASIPGLGVIVVGNRRESMRYVEKKLLAVETAGFHAQVIHLDESATESQVISDVKRLNNDRTIHGILVQLPLPSHINQLNVLRTIDIDKDVDGFHPYNMGLLALKASKYSELMDWSIGAEMQLDSTPQSKGMDWLMNTVACAPKACMLLLNYYGISVSGKRVVVLGQSPIVGVPMVFLLMSSNAIVSTTNENCGATANQRLCQEADIIISAVGKAHLLSKEWMKPGATVIDVGINFLPRTEYKRTIVLEGIHTDPNPTDILNEVELVGDAYFDDIVGHAGAVTPVPRGVGPVTVAMLLENTFLSFIQMHRTDK